MGETAFASFSPESMIMRLLQRIGFESLAWSLRRLYCPVSEEALVLEVGSGGNPYPRANVLLDAHEETRQRHWAPLKADRPFVFGVIERLPFKTGAFDFLIASHVLEHSTNPEKALAEFQRVAEPDILRSQTHSLSESTRTEIIVQRLLSVKTNY